MKLTYDSDGEPCLGIIDIDHLTVTGDKLDLAYRVEADPVRTVRTRRRHVMLNTVHGDVEVLLSTCRSIWQRIVYDSYHIFPYAGDTSLDTRRGAHNAEGT